MRALNRQQAWVVGIAMVVISLVFLGIMFSPRGPFGRIDPWNVHTAIPWIVYLVVMTFGGIQLLQK